jgi:H+/Cl- antiporter ClcA
VSRLKYIEPFVMLVTLAQWLVLATITGVIVGTGTSLFLHGLSIATGESAHIPLWVQMILLPAGGLVNGLILYYGYRHASGKKDSVIAAVHEQAGDMPYKTFFIKPVAALVTLGTGGSAGKEGPCAHIGGTLASLFGRLTGLSPEMRKWIVACGVSAGFSSVFGTPIAGAIYGIEVLTIGRLRHDFLFPAVIAGVVSFEVSKFWGIRYPNYILEQLFVFSGDLFIKILLIGVVCGLVSWLFIELLEQTRALFGRIQRTRRLWPPLVPLLGGLVLSALILVIPTDYLGLSLPLMNRALAGEEIPYLAFFWKSLLVAITLGSGFYGGIATPQLVIGAVTGNVCALLLGVDPALGAATGMVAVLASASNTPVAAIFMGFELFGSLNGIYAVSACVTAYIIIGHRSVYPDQLVAYSKSLWMRLQTETALEKQKIHISYSVLKKLRRMQRSKYFRSGRRGRPKRR